MEGSTDSQFATWATPQCPFVIEYSLRVLDDIRLAVVDAFFSLPRGGAEIGGILLGTVDKTLVRISDYAALDCEHAYGPSFTLSDRDYAKFDELLAIARRSGGSLVPVGWYHSHTRSEVFFSDADIAIHKRFFPESWQVALVLKPHAFEPVRAGFFFRETGGVIYGAASYQEFTLTPQLVQQAAAGAGISVPSVPAILDRPAVATPQSRPEKKLQSEAASVPGPNAVPSELKPPTFGTAEPPAERSWGWLAAGAVFALLVGGGYQTRSAWLPQLQASAARLQSKPAAAAAPQPQNAAPVAEPVALGLNTTDENGQLHITWDRNSPTVRNGASGILAISEGPAPLIIPLDAAHLQSGSFTYGRENNRVDVSLTVQSPGGQSTKEVSVFIGTTPPKSVAEDPTIRQQRDDLAREAAKLKSDLQKQAERTQKLEKSMDQMRLELIRQQRVRMQNMSPDVPKEPGKR